MPDNSNVVNLLLQLSDVSKRLADALSEQLKPDIGVVETPIPTASVVDDITRFELWPTIVQEPQNHNWIKNNLITGTTLELCGLNSIAQSLNIDHDHLESDDIDVSGQEIKLNNIRDQYDNIIANEVIQFYDRPFDLLAALKSHLKHNGKIFMKCRPWTAYNGAFTWTKEGDDKRVMAYKHLVTNTECGVKHRVTQPLAEYSLMIKTAGLNILSRKINTISVPDYIKQPEILELLTLRTWGHKDPTDACRILATSSVEYILSIM